MLATTILVFATTVLRKHPRRQLKKLAYLIKQFGFVVPILVDQDNVIIAGEARVKAAQLLGLTHVPAIRVLHLTDPEVRALRIADNRLAELSDWDRATLTVELVDLDSLLPDINLTGFETPEIDLLINAKIPKPSHVACDDCPPARFDLPAVTALNDIWLFGPHRVACGDARDPQITGRLMAGETAAQLLSDIPYNVKIEGNVGGKGKIKHPEFLMASGEMSDEEFIEFIRASLGLSVAQCKDGALLYVFIDWRHVHQVIAVGLGLGLTQINLCVWTKSNAGMGSFYRSQHELIVVFKKGSALHTNNIELGRHGRNRSNVWPYEGANSINPERRRELKLHPTVKPAQLCIDAILDCTHRSEIVLDPFLGSGTTLIAAEDCGRICYGVEISPHYVDVIVRRWQEFTGESAVLESSGETFAQTERLRFHTSLLASSSTGGQK
ncbi:MAG TPA: DNA methyltransferase [Rhizomicrobium sp.]|jgi:DNA modification methylase